MTNKNKSLGPSHRARVVHIREQNRNSAKGKEVAKKSETERALLKAHDNICQKCYNPKNPSYHHYGGRGITIHGPWRADRRLFVKEVIEKLGPRPTPKHSLDRWPNPHGNYEPGNLRWASPAQQAANRRTTTSIYHNGEIVPRPTAAHEMGAKPNTLAKRLDRGSLEDPRLRNFEANWNRSLGQVYGRYLVLLSKDQKRKVYETIVRLPPNLDISLVANSAILFWPEFMGVAEDECGLWDRVIPSTPQLEFFLKNIETAVDFWRRKRAERDRTKRLADQQKAHDDWENGDDATDDQELGE
jgi:hypothetical protein